ncbi:MAG: response regulator [Gammaproteobacteria bacterium]|jgi:signal transduction histidine kinase/CheY-like chemotaxis protein|nr:response regulator [Gammaproteobacteria bacterium]
MHIKNWRVLIIILVVFLTASYLIFHGYRNAQIVHENTAEAINNHQLKRNLLTTMYNASQERSVILLKMHIEVDPFNMDDMKMQMGVQAGIFIQARQKLITLSLSKKEKEILEKQKAAAMKNAPLQDYVAQLFLDGKSSEATELLIKRAIPDQHAMRDLINETIEEFDKDSEQLIEDIRKNFQDNNSISLLLGALLVFASIAIIFIVMTRLSRQEEKIIKNALKQAKRANKAKSEFLSRMSHELRTPLHAIIAFSDLILYEKDLKPKLEKHIQHINTAGSHLLTLIDEVLDLAKIESGKLTVLVEPVKLQAVLEECYSLIKPIALNAGIRLSFDTQVDYIVNADHTSLKQALLNLLSNAVKYNRQQGSVTVSYEFKNDKRLRINVIDTGKGISAKQQKQLFMPFERMDAGFGDVKGTGIGLTIAQQLIEMMGGAVGVKSTKGEGSNFWIELVLNDEQKAALPELAPTRHTDRHEQQSKRIVYVEDEPINAHLMSEIIKKLTNHHLVIAKTGSEGLKLILEELPDLVLLDIGLPDMDGYKILEQMRAHPQAKKIPAIAVTARAMMDDVERGERAGFDDYIVKPVMAAELLKSIELTKREY